MVVRRIEAIRSDEKKIDCRMFIYFFASCSVCDPISVSLFTITNLMRTIKLKAPRYTRVFRMCNRSFNFVRRGDTNQFACVGGERTLLPLFTRCSPRVALRASRLHHVSRSEASATSSSNVESVGRDPSRLRHFPEVFGLCGDDCGSDR